MLKKLGNKNKNFRRSSTLKLRENEYNANFNTSKVNLKIAITVSIYIPCVSDTINISCKQSSILNKNYDKRKY